MNLYKIYKTLKGERIPDPEYFGEKAKNYDEKRIFQKKWKDEQSIVYKYLKQISSHNKSLKVLDIPVGTGRFFDFYKEFNFSVVGMDISDDMLEEAEKKAKIINLKAKLMKGNITNISMPDKSFDVVICIRIFNLMNFNNFLKSISEVVRTSRKYIIFGVIVYTPIREIFLKTSLYRFFYTMFRRMQTNLSMSLKKIKGVYHFRHKKKRVLKEFKKNNLDIIEQKIINKGEDGSIYYIFLLEKLRKSI